MKSKLFLLTTAALALTPAIVTDAEESLAQAPQFLENEWTTLYESPLAAAELAQDTRTIASTRSLEYTANSAQSMQGAFLSGLEQFGDVITIHYTGSLEFQQLYDEVLNVWDNMHDLNDYLSGNVSNIKLKGAYNGNTKTVTINMNYHANYTQQQFITEQVQQIAQQIIKPGMSDFEKVKAINDYIVFNFSYNANTKSSPHSVYTFLTEKQGVCQAYALLAQRLFEEAGIRSHYVTGYARQGHAWNLVQVDGEWYHIDVTWADPVFSKYDDSNINYISYGYFLMSDQQIAKDHTVDKKEKNLPKATSTRYTALHSIKNPVQVGDELFFPNSNDDIRLYKINLNDPVPTATKVSNTRFQHLFYANGFLYFSNYSNSGYLSKMDMKTQEITVVLKEQVTHILRHGQYMTAYNISKIVYSEEIRDDGTALGGNDSIAGTISPAAQKVIELIDALDRSAATFLDDYNHIYGQIEALTEQERGQITNMQRYVESYAIADTYYRTYEKIQEAIDALNVATPLATLKELAVKVRKQVNDAVPAVAVYLDLTNLKVTERFIAEKELEASNDKEINAKLEEITALIYALDESLATFFEDFEDVSWRMDDLTEQQLNQIPNVERYYEYANIAEQYYETFEQITDAINELNDATPLATLKELVAKIRKQVKDAPLAVVMHLDLTNLEAVEQRIAEQTQQEEASNGANEYVNLAQILVKDVQFLSKDFITRAEQITLLLQMLGDEAAHVLPKDLLVQAQHIQQKYEKMQNVSFQNSSAFGQAKTIKNALKPWTITLTHEIANTPTNLKKINVVDMFGSPIDAHISINVNQIIITPMQNYEPDIPYTLVIEAGLQSTKGKSLSRGQHLQFTFKK